MLRGGAALLLLGVLALVPWLAASDSRVRGLALTSLKLAGYSTLLSVPVGSVLAWLLSRTDLPGRRFFFGLLGGMIFIPLYLQAAAWEAGFGQLGWYTISADQVAAPWLDGFRAAVWVHFITAVPWVVVIVSLGLHYVEPEIEEGALLDGGYAAVFWRITLPRAMAAIGIAGLWVFVTGCSEMVIADLFLVSTYARELYAGQALGDQLGDAWRRTLPSVGMLAWLVVAAAMGLALVTQRSGPGTLRRPLTFSLGRARWLSAALAALAVALIAGVPLFNLAVKAGVSVESIGGERVRSWSLLKFWDVTAPTINRFGEEFRWSLAIGLLAATATIIVAGPLAWWARRGGWRAVAPLSISAASLATPGPLIGLTLIFLLNRPGLYTVYDKTLLGPVLAVSIRSLPFALGICWFGFSSVAEEVLESGELDGAGPLRRFAVLATPQRLPVWFAAWLAAFSISLGDLSASILVYPPGVETIARRLFGLIHSGVRYQEAGLALVSAVLFALIAGLGWWMLSRTARALTASPQ